MPGTTKQIQTPAEEFTFCHCICISILQSQYHEQINKIDRLIHMCKYDVVTFPMFFITKQYNCNI